jgi:hypothetical protein
MTTRIVGLLIAAMMAWPVVVRAQTIPADLEVRLTSAQADAYRRHLAAKAEFDRRLDAYWSDVNARRDERRRKFAQRVPFTAADYVATQPPKYAGPPVPPDVAKIIAETTPPRPDRELPRVSDYLAQARAQFGFVPNTIPEREFKRRYAAEALAVGFSGDQIVRVYALETGGIGTYDMQAGINPVTRQGKPISSALGYAQLLHANSTSELVKHGETLIRRLTDFAATPGLSAQRAVVLRGKAATLRRMLAAARRVPNEWSAHQRFAATELGLGIHALNLDADIGPMLQVAKLRGLLDTAASEAGRVTLTAAELELMNLAGPRTGLEMLQPIGRTMPTANFFSQAGYYRNTIVRERTGAELLAALDDRMNENLKKPGSIEFIQIFAEITAGRSAVAGR